MVITIAKGRVVQNILRYLECHLFLHAQRAHFYWALRKLLRVIWAEKLAPQVTWVAKGRCKSAAKNFPSTRPLQFHSLTNIVDHTIGVTCWYAERRSEKRLVSYRDVPHLILSGIFIFIIFDFRK